jgi:RNA polymerase sigma-70 factor, ECF subfamily
MIDLAEQAGDSGTGTLITEGQAIVPACVQRDHLGPYQLQAAINAVHSIAPSFDRTGWRPILTLCDQLHALTPAPVVALNRAVALAEVRGPAAGVAAVDELRTSGSDLDGYYPFHAARAGLLRGLGRDEEPAAAFAAARALTANPVEQAFLDAQRTAVSGPPAAPRLSGTVRGGNISRRSTGVVTSRKRARLWLVTRSLLKKPPQEGLRVPRARSVEGSCGKPDYDDPPG